MRGSYKNFKRRSMETRILDRYYLDRILEHHINHKDDECIMKKLGISKEDFEKYRNRLKREGKWNQ